MAVLRIYMAAFFLVMSLGIETSYAQNKSDRDSLSKNIIDKVLELQSRNQNEIAEIVSTYKSDTLLLKNLLKSSDAINYPEGSSYALNTLGGKYRDMSRYEEAIEAHKSAYQYALAADNLEMQVISLNLLGVVYRRMDIIKPALDYHKSALELANSSALLTPQLEHSISVSRNSLGNIYLVLKQYDLALDQFHKSIVTEKKHNNLLGLAINHQNIGFVDEAQGRLDQALEQFNISLDYNNQINSDLGRVICYNSIGKIYLKQKRYQDAQKIIALALEMSLTLADQYYIGMSYINMGLVYLELKDYDMAEPNFIVALQTGEAFRLKNTIVDANKYLSEVYIKRGDYKTALEHYKTSIEVENTISNERNLKYANDILIQYENEAKNNQIKALADENEAVKLKLQRNQTVFWYTLTGIIVLGIILVSINRNRQLNHEKQILTLEQDMLRSQMNPHFIFNSLNSIKLYIINNEKENAVYYLNKFSKFIRKILIASTEKEITLEEELDTMELYMNIENIRFSNEINFTISVDKSINLETIKVPSLILQPFLENALWHGLSSKKSDKKISLNINQDLKDFVKVTITDNGIGREASEAINSKRFLKRKSVGITITKARLANFSKNYTEEYILEIIDLVDDLNQPEGTKIVVYIPTRLNKSKRSS